ncbi:WD40-repeat-containing domain protein [Chytridium lagenaria]|nr:WD40-repeat-containing domain protein [Chytridium lagenaria]
MVSPNMWRDKVFYSKDRCVNTLQWNSNGTNFSAVQVDDCKFNFWNPYAEKPLLLSVSSEHTSNIFAARYLGDSDLHIASCAANGQVRFTVLGESGKVESNGLFSCHTDIAFDVRPDPVDGRVFFSSSDDGLVNQYDTRVSTSCSCTNGCMRHTLLDINKLVAKKKSQHTARAASASHSPSWSEDQTAENDENIVGDTNNQGEDDQMYIGAGRASHIMSMLFPTTFQGVASMSFDPNFPAHLALGCSDGNVRVFDRRYIRSPGWNWEDASAVDEARKSQIYHFRPQKFNDASRRHKITCLQYDPKGTGDLLVSYSGEKVYLVRPNSPEAITNSDEGTERDIINSYGGHRNERTIIKEACFYGDKSQYVMSGSDDGRLFIWSKDSGEVINVLRGDKSVVNCIAPNPLDPFIAVSGIDHDVKLLLPVSPKPWDKEELKTYEREQTDSESEGDDYPHLTFHTNNQVLMNLFALISRNWEPRPSPNG